MNNKKTELYFLLAMITLVSVLSFFIFKPFLYAMILAVVFGTLCEPLHQKIYTLTRGKKVLSAFLATLSVFLIVVIPITLLSAQVAQEATTLYFSVTQNGTADISQFINERINTIQNFFNISNNTTVNIEMYIEYGINWLLGHLGAIFSNLTAFGINLLIFLFALYYVFKDGALLRRAIIVLSPLTNTHDETILKKFTDAIGSVVQGSLVVSIVQGVITAIGLFLFGVPNPVLWGSVAAITALIPALGTALVLGPAILYLFAIGSAASAIGLLVWGIFAVGLVDNFLGPRLVERGIQIHPFLVLLSIVGGISFFGPLGFLFGPLVLSFLHSLIEIYFLIQKEK